MPEEVTVDDGDGVEVTGEGPPAKQQRLDNNPLTGVPYTRRFYELLEARQKLPAWAAREDFLRLVHSNQVTILVGSPGSGKSTQVPQILLDAGYHVLGGRIKSLACVQPSDAAAALAAQRVADELEVPLGSHVGCVGRFEDRSGQESLLKLVTDEALLHELVADPQLEKYSVVILDEAHERTLATDVLLPLLRRTLQKRSELKLIVMSATMDAKRMQGYFGGAPLLRMPSRSHPVEVYYMPEPGKDYLWTAARTAIQIHRNEGPGDILMFLPCEEEVDRACAMLRKEAAAHPEAGELRAAALHAHMRLEEQLRAFEPAPGPRPGSKPSRRVVVATGIAETSVAVDGIAYVVDAGLERQRFYDPRTRLECQRPAAVSRATSLRRADCAGRAGAGKCYRLYNERVLMQELSEHSCPEVLRANLTGTVLALKRLGVTDLVRFEFIDPPPPEALMRALETLNHLGCLDDRGELTQLGMQCAALPVDPQLARMLLESPAHKCTSEALSIAAMLCVGPVFLRPQGAALKDADAARQQFTHLDGDHLSLLNVYHAYKQHLMDGLDTAAFCSASYLCPRALAMAETIRTRLQAVLGQLGARTTATDFNDKEYYPNIRRCIVSGFFMQAAFLEDPKGATYLTVKDCQSALLHPYSTLDKRPECVVYNEFVLTSRSYIRTATRVKAEWLLDFAPAFYDLRRLPEPGQRAPALRRAAEERLGVGAGEVD